jgi:hypothetical protein
VTPSKSQFPEQYRSQLYSYQFSILFCFDLVNLVFTLVRNIRKVRKTRRGLSSFCHGNIISRISRVNANIDKARDSPTRLVFRTSTTATDKQSLLHPNSTTQPQRHTTMTTEPAQKNITEPLKIPSKGEPNFEYITLHFQVRIGS